MTFLVLNAAGAQGGAVARKLVAEGLDVRGFSRSGKVPAGAQPAVGNLGDAAAVAAAFAGVSHASVMLPMVYEPDVVERYVRNVRDAALAAGVRRLVVNTGNRLPGHDSGLPVFETRRRAVRTLREAGLPVVELRPAVYLDNLAAPWVAGPLAAEGVLAYPLPSDLPVAWLAHEDLAACTHAALLADGLEGATVNLGPSESVTGAELAAAIGARYLAQDVDVFEKGLTALVDPPTAAAIAATYRLAADDPALLAADPAAPDLLGVRPTPPRTWLAAQPWARR
ncbi:SDR family oxidoreductase [Nonomuraea typhae]|uniref:SDR family oxidoreductase n=1 Tax=Nonomuraea typhae TaxID=2603600 RepID=UPI0012F72483|nr:NmrA family NAD(P)-binding protein [Nonomuraea typhae]